MFEFGRSVITRALGRGIPLVTILSLTLPAVAVDVPSLEQIKATAQQRHAKIRNLYVETVAETSTPLSLEEYRRLRGYCWLSWMPNSPKVEYHYAMQGTKRYSRKIRHCDPKGPFLEASAAPRARVSFWDQIRAYNETSVWGRTEYRDVHPNGHVEVFGPSVEIGPVGGQEHFLYPPEYRGINLGVLMTGPGLSSDDPLQDPKYMPDHRGRWSLTVSNEIEEVDGAECVALNGTIEMRRERGTGPRKWIRHVRCCLDLERGLALRRWEETRCRIVEHDADASAQQREKAVEEWQHGRLLRVLTSRLDEIESGVWFPQEIELQSIVPAEAETCPKEYRGKLVVSTRIRVTKCIVNKVPDDVFDPLIKSGDDVFDERLVSPFTGH